MLPEPLYAAEKLRAAYQVRYNWTGWPTRGARFPPSLEAVANGLCAEWEADGLRLLEAYCSDTQAQLLFSVKPQVAPLVFTARVKGRLQHALRRRGAPVVFSRKLAMRSIGENHTADVAAYIQSQVSNARFCDPRFAEFLQAFTVVNPGVDLSAPTETVSGRYWQNLHIVLVMEEGCWITDAARLTVLRDGSLRIAEKKGHGVAYLSVMPDHLHVAMRGNIEHSPEEIAMAFINNLAFMLGQVPLWRPGYYAGTFSEYDMEAVRRSVAERRAEDSESGSGRG